MTARTARASFGPMAGLLCRNSGSHRGKRWTGDAHDSPIGQDGGAKGAVELDRGSVPIEDGPLESPASPLARDCSKRCEQSLRAAAATKFRPHEEVFEPEAPAPQECREVVKVQSEAGRDRPVPRDQHFGRGMGPEKRGLDVTGARDQKVRQLLANGERDDHRVYGRDILALCRADGEWAFGGAFDHARTQPAKRFTRVLIRFTLKRNAFRWPPQCGAPINIRRSKLVLT